jgi:ubiquinone/menaquinone biosynthesis C-methylase UbiE
VTGTSRSRGIWDAAARTGSDRYLGRPEHAEKQLESLLRDLGAQPAGAGRCLEIGCGAGRMTMALARRWREVLAVDISPAMLERARVAVDEERVTFALVSGDRLDGIADRSADVAICYGVLQHFPTRSSIGRMLTEVERVLDIGGEAFVQLPVLERGVRARLWRVARTAVTQARKGRNGDFTRASEYRGTRLTQRELAQILRVAGLAIVARSDRAADPTLLSTYPHCTETRLRLRPLAR